MQWLNKDNIKLAVMAVVAVVSLWFLWKEHKACSKVGGILVRSTFWVSCVDEVK